MQRVRMSSHQLPVQKLGDSEMKLTPRFKLASVKDGLLESESCFEPLIPGLPDDIGLSCLLRLPVEFHPGGRSVCRRWYNLFKDKGWFFTQRKEMGFQNPYLFVFSFNKCSGKIQWHVLDLVNLSWHTIPEMPWMDKVCPHGFRCVSVPGDGSVFVCGGPQNSVLKFDVRLNRWNVMKKMITPRSFFASGVIDGMVYVAGGNSSDGFELNSAEVMDPKSGVWCPIEDMGANMACYDAAVLNGKLYVTEGWFWPFYVVPRGQVYDPKTKNWECMATGLREGWTGSSVVMFGHLFVVSEHERTKLKVYDSKNDVWETVNGSPLPEKLCKPFAVNGYNDTIYVTGKNLYVAVGLIHRLDHNDPTGGSPNFSVQWQVVETPQGFFDLTPASAQILLA
ncbi:F-box/kelch-repeat protein At1g30090-like [Rutidosis leptorrhynchoides]|uniref:F-box/kelch-repeat protein At1g30090-like n=1 Tax=Rutidosis leptorrhynchoides TaxID=125765 RepID=UPI003A994879